MFNSKGNDIIYIIFVRMYEFKKKKMFLQLQQILQTFQQPPKPQSPVIEENIYSQVQSITCQMNTQPQQPHQTDRKSTLDKVITSQKFYGRVFICLFLYVLFLQACVFFVFYSCWTDLIMTMNLKPLMSQRKMCPVPLLHLYSLHCE